MSADARVILFDVGGVLVELLGVPVMQNWTAGRYTLDELWQAWVDSPAVIAFETGQMTESEFAAQAIAEFGLPVDPQAFLDEFITWPGRLYPGVLELLEDLARRFELATLSNTNPLHWPLVTEGLGIGKHIQTHFPSHVTGLAKPDRAAFDNAARRLGVSPDQILFLDDNAANIAAAREAGLNAHRAEGITGVRRVLSDLDLDL